jgi:2-iminobutanoate/2-iminopropanoate deaminase
MMPSKSERVFTTDAPKPVGPYSQAIRAGDYIYVAGQVPFNPATNEMVTGSITESTVQCMKNIKAILTTAGASLVDIVRTTIYLTKIEDFGDVNEAYSRFFDLNPPARTTIGVAALPGGAPIEIDVIAYSPKK